MTDEQINTAIAEVTGLWDYPYSSETKRMYDFCTDLNAMNEAEKVLNYEQCEAFTNTVADIVHAENREKDYPFPWGFARIHATARQRAEAVLRTLGKWEEATDKESLTVQQATTEESSAVQKEVQG
jgi:hypothetical protein